MRLVQTLTLALVAAALTVGCGSSPPQKAAPSGPPQHAAPSVPRGEAIVAALRASQVERNPARAFSHIQTALQHEPERKELVWLAARLCVDVPRCEPQVYESRLRKLDPGNGVVWTGPLADAQARGDDAAETQILEALSRESRFDVYWNTLLAEGALARAAQSREPAPKMLNGPLANAIVEVSGWLTAVAMPSFTNIANACSQERTRIASVAERCRNVAKVLQSGDTYAAEAVGLGIAQRASRADSPSIVALAEHAAVLSYQHDTAGEILGYQVEREKMSAERIELMKKLRREQDVSIAVLKWAGVPLMPQM